MEIKQFKLSSGEEVVCEVLEWPNVEEDESDIVVRNVFKIVSVKQSESGNRFYIFKPWMIFQDEEGMFQLINNNHITGEGNPSAKLLEQYFLVLRGNNPEESANDDIEKRLEEYINKLKDMVSRQTSNDSADENIILFPGGRTIH